MSHKKDARLIWVKLPFYAMSLFLMCVVSLSRCRGLVCSVWLWHLFFAWTMKPQFLTYFEILLGVMIIKFSNAMSVWIYTHITLTATTFMFVSMLYVSVNNFTVVSGRFPVFLGWTSTKHLIKCLAQGHNTVTTDRPSISNLRRYKLSHCAPAPNDFCFCVYHVASISLYFKNLYIMNQIILIVMS